MYRSGSTTRYQGIGNRPPSTKQRMDAHEHLRSQMDDGAAQREREWKEKIDKLIADLIIDEEEAINKYQRLKDEVQRYSWNSPIADIAIHIQSQERQHKALLQKMR